MKRPLAIAFSALAISFGASHSHAGSYYGCSIEDPYKKQPDVSSSLSKKIKIDFGLTFNGSEIALLTRSEHFPDQPAKFQIVQRGTDEIFAIRHAADSMSLITAPTAAADYERRLVGDFKVSLSISKDESTTQLTLRCK